MVFRLFHKSQETMSRHTLSALLEEAGFQVLAFRGAGRFPWLWKSMLLAARKPLE